MATAKTFNPSLVGRRDGSTIDTSAMNGLQRRNLGKQLEDDEYFDDVVAHIKSMGDPRYAGARAPEPPAAISGQATWGGYGGLMKGLRRGAEAQGKNFNVKGLSMPTTQRAPQQQQRPSMAALGIRGGSGMGGVEGVNDGWEHPDVRAAKLSILQGHASAGRQADIDAMRARDPNLVAYDREQADKTAIASAGRLDEGLAPIQGRQRQRARDEGVADTRAAALEQEINPFFRSERDRADKNLETRASMDAFARIMGSMRPETAEVFESNPALADRIRGSVMGQPAPGAGGTGDQTGGGVPMQDDAGGAAAAGPIASAADIAPDMRADIEQQLRERGYVVNDQTVMAAYNFLQGR